MGNKSMEQMSFAREQNHSNYLIFNRTIAAATRRLQYRAELSTRFSWITCEKMGVWRITKACHF